MYKITRKGKGEPLFVNDVEGRSLFEAWSQEKTIPARLVIDGLAFMSSDIKAIEYVPLRVETKQEEIDHDKEYQSFRTKMLSLSIEQRAEIMRIPDLIWMACTDEPMPPKVRAEIKAAQLAYLTENPNCLYANPKVYRHLIPAPKTYRVTENMTSIKNVLPAATLRLVENIIHTDLVYAGQRR